MPNCEVDNVSLFDAAQNEPVKMLVAEEAPENQRFIAWVLKKSGANVDVVADGQAALEKFLAAEAGSTHYDLVLTDLEMPHMSGIELTAKLRNLGYRIPIIALTAYSSAEVEVECFLAGCDGYIAKPFPPDALLATCCRLLTSRASAKPAAVLTWV